MRRHRPYFVLSLALCLAAISPASALAAPPTILSTTVTDVSGTSATLKATLKPNGQAGTYHFEYDATKYAVAEGPHGTATEELSFPNSANPVEVEAPISGLSPGTTYHFRVAASAGTLVNGPDRVFTTTTPSSPFDPCPNEEFRSGNLAPNDKPSAALPDCRAYEQASPVEKHGLDTLGTYPTTKASPAGDAITFATSSAIPGGEGAQEPPLYLARRNAQGWTTQGMLPPAEVGSLARAVGWTPDFAHVFSWAERFEKPKDTSTFLDTPTAGGSLTQIYPYVAGPQPNFVGASADGSLVFFEAFGIDLTEGDAPARNNLYVWDRTSEEIALVGALPDPECAPALSPCAPAGGSFAGPYDWVNGDSGVPLTFGGALSSYYTQEEHAVSEDGSRAYFTAGGGQIYMREDPLGPSPQTDHVSASEKDEGNGKEGTDAAGVQPAAFMAATPDGSQAFFTSSEKLTNDATTGPEPTKVAAIARGNIADGKGEEFEFLPAKAKGIAISGSHIYWADPSTNLIGRAKLGTSEPEDEEPTFIAVPEVEIEVEPGVFSKVPARPQYVAVDPAGEYVYWTNAPDDQPGHGSIGRAKLGGLGGVEGIDAEYIEGKEAGGEEKLQATNPQGIAVNSEFIYWANAGKDDATRTIGRAKSGVSDPEGVSGEFIKVGNGGFEHTPQGITINATHIYMTVDSNQEQSYILRFDLDGDESTEKLLFDSQHIGKPGLRGIALDSGHVYWAREGADAIGRVDFELEEGSREREWIKPADHPRGVAVDGTHIYWAANQEAVANPGNDLYRYDAVTGKLTDLAVDTSDTNGIEARGVLAVSADGSRVYFVANGVPGGLQGSPNEEGESAAPGNCRKVLGTGGGICNLYLWHNGTISFIARIEDEANWTGTPAGVIASTEAFQKTARLSADGETLLFTSSHQLTSNDNAKGASELYRYRAGEGLACISCRPSGEAPVGISTVPIITPLMKPESPASTLSRSLSADGNRVFFESTDALVAEDTNYEFTNAEGEPCPIVGSDAQSFPACQDIYEWEAKGTGSCKSEAQNGGCLHLLSTGKGPYPSFFLDASASGDDVFIVTRSPLVRQDIDGVMDVYDVKAGGGLPGQNEQPDVCLSTEDCHDSPPPPPPSPPSVTEVPGGGNVKGKAPCRKPKRLVKAKGKTRCVAKKHQKKHHGKRRKGAGKSGRAGR